jgi:DNA-binding transcriptional regulator YiaG
MTGPELRDARRRLGLTQSALAEWLGVASEKTVAQWENERRRVPPWVAKRLEERQS